MSINRATRKAPAKVGTFLVLSSDYFSGVSLDEYRGPDSVTMLRAVRVAMR
jgi:hypothetical protein